MSDHRHTMRRFYRNWKASSGDKFDRRWHRRSDKLKEPDVKHPIIKEQPCLKENHEGPSQSSSRTSEGMVNGCVENTCNENADDGTSSNYIKAHVHEALNDLSMFQDSMGVTNDEIEVVDDVEEEDESLLGLQFLLDDDEIDDHVKSDANCTDLKRVFPSLPWYADRSFCISSDSDEYSTDTVDTSSGVSDSTRKSYYPSQIAGCICSQQLNNGTP